MEKKDIIKNIAKRSGGDIYLGVVGAVRTGKSTFIKRMVETLIIPNMESVYEQKRTLDEIPQSASGKTIMTTEPKFIPTNAAKIKVDDFTCNIKLIDCVGYMIENAIGATDENGPRMVKTPWYNEEIPFIEAAEIGTEKVIKEHSTIGIVVTTDGSIGDFERKDYEEAENRVVEELKTLGKPFIIILNTTHPSLPETEQLKIELEEKYQTPVLPISIESMTEQDMYHILKEALYEFPVLEIKVNMPEWISILEPNNKVKKAYIQSMKESIIEIDKIRDVEKITEAFQTNEYIKKCYLSEVDTSTGSITINLSAPEKLYQETLKELVNKDIKTKVDLLSLFQEYSIAKKEYDSIKYALNMVKQTGYGIATPSIEDMKLDSPEVIKQGSRYGIKLKAVAPSIHMIRVDVESTFEPIIGSEVQSKELIDYITKDQDKNPKEIWKSEIFGRSLDSIVQEGIQSKINLMPENIRFKLQNTLTKVINKGSNNVITLVI
ncbi:MAG: stage IV sporulation protein A [Bacilli bacterium]|nr:stage IV sporulation protein A [Bacilli bacterium]